MVYSKTPASDGRTELSIGEDRIIVGVDHEALDNSALQERYTRLQDFKSNVRSFQLLKHKLLFALFIFLPLLSLVMAPSLLAEAGITGSSSSLLAQTIWTLSLVISASAFLIACCLAIVRSYYRHCVFSELEAEFTALEDELRQRGLDVE